MNWTKDLSIGNINIDNDHKKLIEVYNDLIDLNALNKNREEFAKILSKMTEYALRHFKKEEMYMEEFKYPKLSLSSVPLTEIQKAVCGYCWITNGQIQPARLMPHNPIFSEPAIFFCFSIFMATSTSFALFATGWSGANTPSLLPHPALSYSKQARPFLTKLCLNES